MKTRVRFAPSPTGPLHMGGVRTALYNYLYAKKNGGDFIIRIEDTDSHRFVPGAEKYIIESLRWCGIIPDEGVDAEGNVVETPSAQHPHAPYRQSQRRGIYRKYAQQLVDAGWAYYAFDSAEDLERRRSEAEAKGETFIYNWSTRGQLRNSLTLSVETVARLISDTDDWTIRFKMPENETVCMDDMVRGHIEVNSSTLDDKVLWKRADELPTYHLANIVDDHLMEITEVIRGEEWLPSLPLHYLLYKAFGWNRPQFAHLPLLLKPVGNGKLSKRDGDKMGFPVFPLQWTNPEGETSHGYREDGYFPEAFVNLLAMLGWNPGTEQELFSMDELVQAFSIDKVGKSGAKFNPEKAKWFNKEYLRKKSDSELASLFMPVLASHGVSASFDYVVSVVSLIKERATFVADFWTIASYLFIAPSQFAEFGVKAGAASEKPADGRPVDPRAKVYDDTLTAPFLAKDVDKFWKADVVPAALEALKACVSAAEGSAASGAAGGSGVAGATCVAAGSGVAGATCVAAASGVAGGSGVAGADCIAAVEAALEGYIRSHELPMGKVMNCLRLALTGASSGLGIADIIARIGYDAALARFEFAVSRLG